MTVAYDEFKEMELSNMARFMIMGEAPCWWMCGGCLIGRRLRGGGFIIGGCEDD